jgi:thymidylate synthase
MALPPCHDYFQVVVKPLSIDERILLYNNKKNIYHYDPFVKLSYLSILKDNFIPEYGFELHWHQRSVDTFLGLPYNIASYATLALILEKITGYKALAIQGDLKKVHLYDNSLDAVEEQLSRDVGKYDKCELSFESKEGKSNEISLKSIESLDTIINNLYINGFQLKNYESYPAINVEMLERDE